MRSRSWSSRSWRCSSFSCWESFKQPSTVLAHTTPDCIFQTGGSQAAYYNAGVVSVPLLAAGQTFHIPPGAYQQIMCLSGLPGL